MANIFYLKMDGQKESHHNHLLVKRTPSKLTENGVRGIKQKLKEGELSKNLANLYKVSASTINNIKYGNNWKNL